MAITDIISLIMIIVTGITCNLMAILFIYRKSSKTSLKDKIIAVLCFINLFQTVGYSIELHLAIQEDIKEHPCIIAAFLICFATYSSIGCFVALMVERYVSIVYPFKYMQWFSGKMVAKLCLLSPIVYGFLFGIPPIIGWGHYGQSRPNATYCGFTFNNNTKLADESYFFTVLGFALGLPLALTGICFAHILLELKRTASSHTRKFGKASNISRSSKKTVNEQYISSLLTTLIYIMSWLPYSIVCVLFYMRRDVPMGFELFAIYMSKSSTVTSPVVFCLIEKRVWSFLRKEDDRLDMLFELSPIGGHAIDGRSQKMSPQGGEVQRTRSHPFVRLGVGLLMH